MTRRTSILHALRWHGVADGLLDALWSGDTFRLVDVAEEWDVGRGRVRLAGSVAVDASATVDVAGLGVSLGDGGHGVEVPFTVDLPALPVVTLLTALAARAGILSEVGLSDLPGMSRLLGFDPTDPRQVAELDLSAITAALRADGPLEAVVGPVPASLGLPERWVQRAVKVVDDTTGRVRLEVDEHDPRVTLPLGTVTLRVGIDGVAADLDPTDSLDLPPIRFVGTSLGMEARGVTFDRDHGELVLDETTIWGLGGLVPGLPDGDASEQTVVQLTRWRLGRDGLTGFATLTSSGEGANEPAGILSLQRTTLEFDRSWWPTSLEAEARLDAGALVGGEPHTVEVVADLRFDPHAAPIERWRLACTVRGDGDRPLVRLRGADLGQLGAACGTAAALAGGPGRGGDIALLLGACSALQRADLASFDELTVEGLDAEIRHRSLPATDGTEVDALTLTLRADVRLGMRLRPPAVDPIAIEVGAAQLEVRLVLDHLSRLATPPLTVYWSLSDGIAVTLPAAIDVAGPVTITNASMRLEDGGLVGEFGIDVSGGGDVAIGGLPDLLTLNYHPADDPGDDTVTLSLRRSDQPLTLLVPGVLYAQGSLRADGDGDGSEGDSGALPLPGDGWGQTLRGSLRAFLVADGPVSDPGALLRKESYLFDLEVGLLTATRAADGLRATVLTLDAGFRPGLPIGASGVGLYGLGLTYAQNAAPNTPSDGDYAGWFLDVEPAFSTGASKWTPAAGQWGFGAAATLGSLPDNGTSWNVAAGLFLLLPGPVVMLTGKGNVFAELPTLPAEGSDPSSVDAAFAAVIALDLLRDRFSLDLRGQFAKQAGDKELVSLHVPAHIHADLRHPSAFRVAVGLPKPEQDRVAIRALGLLDMSAYLVVSGDTFELPRRVGDPVDLPGVAIAFGGAGGLEQRFRAGPVALALWARAGLDVGISLRVPLLAGQLWLDGGVEVSAFGVGASLRANLTLDAIAPQPYYLAGTMRVQLRLPWFLPNLDLDAKLAIGSAANWLDDAPPAASPVEALTLWGRGAAGPTVLQPGEHASDVPLDAFAEVAFSEPVGNEETELGSLSVVGVDRSAPVWAVASSSSDDDGQVRLGYRHVLTAATLRTDDGELLSGIPATWPPGTETGNHDDEHVARTSGGQVARTTLRLFDPLAGGVDARVGLAAELTARRWSTWDPCDIPHENPKDAYRMYTLRSLGHLLDRAFRPPMLGGLADVVVHDHVRPVPWLSEHIREHLEGIVIRPEVLRPDPPLGGVRPDLRVPDVRPQVRPIVPPDVPTKAVRSDTTQPEADRPDVAETKKAIRVEVARSAIGRKRVMTRAAGSDQAEAASGSDQAKAAGSDDTTAAALTPPLTSLVALAPALTSHFGIAELAVTEDARRRARLSQVEKTSTLATMWASSAGATALATGATYQLPNETSYDDLAARLVIEPAAPHAELLRRTFGVTVEPARLGRNPMRDPYDGTAPNDPVLGLPRLVLPVPLSGEPVDEAIPLARMTGRARLDLPDNHQVEALILVAPGVEPLVWADTGGGDERLVPMGWAQAVLVGDDRGAGPVEQWVLRRYTVSSPTTALRFAAVHGPLDPLPDSERLPVVAALVGVQAWAPGTERAADAIEARDRFGDVLGDLFHQRGTWQTAEVDGLLAPDTTYELTVEGRSVPVREEPDRGRFDVADHQAATWSHTFTFTTAARPPRTLRPFAGDAVVGEDDGTRLAAPGSINELWDVATSPADDAPSHYRGDPLVVRFRDARTLAVLGAFGRTLQLRLLDDQGVDVTETIATTLRAATDLPAHDQFVRDRLAALPCLAAHADVTGLWTEAVARVQSVLEPGRRYTAELHAVPAEAPATNGTGSADDAGPVPSIGGRAEPLHRWRFRASRWRGLDEHLAAHQTTAISGTTTPAPLDEITADGSEVVAAIRAAVDADRRPLIVDDELLDRWLLEILRLPARPVPADPELAAIWAWTPDDDVVVPVALLLDSPEALLRHGATLTLVSAGTDMRTQVITDRALARILVVPTDGQLPNGELELVIGTARRTVMVGPRPAAFDEGGDQ